MASNTFPKISPRPTPLSVRRNDHPSTAPGAWPRCTRKSVKTFRPPRLSKVAINAPRWYTSAYPDTGLGKVLVASKREYLKIYRIGSGLFVTDAERLLKFG